MGGIKQVPRGYRLLGGFLAVLVLAGVVGYRRPPVLIVTDPAFDTLYGRRRILVKRLDATVRLLRRVIPVTMSDGATPDMVAIAVGEAEDAPGCVLFPYRYAEGAGRYAARHPAVPVVILGGRAPDPHIPGTIFLGTDRATDEYRAGLMAAILARYQDVLQSGGEFSGEIVFFAGSASAGASVDQDAFRAGLTAQGFQGVPQYVGEDQNVTGKISTVVISGAADSVLKGKKSNQEVPMILFSWINPQVTARPIVAIFDDSPWALAVQAVRTRLRRNGGVLPSTIQFPWGRIDQKVLWELKAAAQENR